MQIFSVLIFTDNSIKIPGLYALSRPRSNLDTMYLTFGFTFFLPFLAIFVIVFVMAKKSEGSYLLMAKKVRAVICLFV